MAAELHYSSTALLLRSLVIGLGAAVVFADYAAHAGGGFPRLFGLDLVPSAMLFATALYLVASTMILTIGLMRHGAVALATSPDGVIVRSAWFARTLAWTDVSHVALDVSYGKSSHHTVVAVHERSGVLRCHRVDTRLLAEPLDRVTEWVDAAERMRLAHGGAPFTTPTTGLAGYAARVQAAEIAGEIAAAKKARGITGR